MSLLLDNSSCFSKFIAAPGCLQYEDNVIRAMVEKGHPDPEKKVSCLPVGMQ